MVYRTPILKWHIDNVRRVGHHLLSVHFLSYRRLDKSVDHLNRRLLQREGSFCGYTCSNRQCLHICSVQIHPPYQGYKRTLGIRYFLRFYNLKISFIYISGDRTEN